VVTSLETGLIGLFEQIYRSLGYTGIVIAMALESACIPLPSEIILPMAGWMVSRQVFTFWGATLAGTLGAVIGSTVAYGDRDARRSAFARCLRTLRADLGA